MKIDLQLLVFAKTMRTNATDAENLMWQLPRQAFYESEISPSACDCTIYCRFYCHELSLVIELDGSQHGTDDAVKYDAERTHQGKM